MDETFFLTKLDLSKNLRLGIHAPLGLKPTGSGAWIPSSVAWIPASDLAEKRFFFQLNIFDKDNSETFNFE